MKDLKDQTSDFKAGTSLDKRFSSQKNETQSNGSSNQLNVGIKNVTPIQNTLGMRAISPKNSNLSNATISSKEALSSPGSKNRLLSTNGKRNSGEKRSRGKKLRDDVPLPEVTEGEDTQNDSQRKSNKKALDMDFHRDDSFDDDIGPTYRDMPEDELDLNRSDMKTKQTKGKQNLDMSIPANRSKVYMEADTPKIDSKIKYNVKQKQNNVQLGVNSYSPMPPDNDLDVSMDSFEYEKEDLSPPKMSHNIDPKKSVIPQVDFQSQKKEMTKPKIPKIENKPFDQKANEMKSIVIPSTKGGLSEKKQAQKTERKKQEAAQRATARAEEEQKVENEKQKRMNKQSGLIYYTSEGVQNSTDNIKKYVGLLPKYEQQNYESQPKNDAQKFVAPKKDVEIDQQIFEYYVRNSYLRKIDADEDPSGATAKYNLKLQRAQTLTQNEAVVKDVRNIHVSSDHQRVYVWAVTHLKTTGSMVASSLKRSLWLQVYSLSSAWASQSSISTEQLQNQLQQMRDEVRSLEEKYLSQATVVLPEKNTDKNLMHSNKGIQSVVEKARKDQIRRQDTLNQKKQQLQQLEKEFREQNNLFIPNPEPDLDQETKAFHNTQNYESIHEAPKDINDRYATNEGLSLFQQSQKAELTILIGEFDQPSNDYLHDIIQSFYKQFITSEQAFYFFKFDMDDPEAKDNQLNLPLPNMGSTSNLSKKTMNDSESVSANPFNACGRPKLYKISAYSNRCELVLNNGMPINLPLDSESNQFSIVRPLDPYNSHQMSFLDNFMVAVMKEIHVKSDPLESNSFNQRDRRSTKQKLAHIQPQLIETVVEIYSANLDQPTIGANIDLREIPAQLNPKNISAFHKEPDSDQEDAKPVNQDFNFCCWYYIDQANKNMNFSILVQQQQINMRTPYRLDPATSSVNEINKRIIVAKNCQFNPYFDETKFLKDFDINQCMPIYCVDLAKPINIANLKSFKQSSIDAKQIWNRELGKQIELELINKVGQPSPISAQTQLQNLVESQDAVIQNLEYDLSHLYIIIKPKQNDIMFEVLYPIIPDYFWSSKEGKNLRTEIDTKLLKNFQNHLEEKPNFSSYIEKGIDENLYSNLFQNLKLGQVQQVSKNILVTNQNKEFEIKLSSDEIYQTAYHHSIFLNDEETMFKRKEFNNYGMSQFPGVLDVFASLIIQKSSQDLKKAKKYHQGKNEIKSHPPLVSQRSVSASRFSKNGGELLANKISHAFAKIKKPSNQKTKFINEKIIFSEDQKTFVHVLKYRKKYMVQKNQVGEIIRMYYKGHYLGFEDNFDFYDFEVTIGQLGVSTNKHMIHLNEERVPLRKNQQILNQFCQYDGQQLPLQNPVTPYQSLLMLTDFEAKKPEKVDKQRFSSFDSFINSQQTPKNEQPKLKVIQVCQKQGYMNEGSDEIDAITAHKNPYFEASFYGFQQDVELRRKFYMEYIKQYNILREAAWVRIDDQVCSLEDYILEQSKVKVWAIPDGPMSQNQVYPIKSIDPFFHINKTSPNFIPMTKCIQDANLQSEPQYWEIMRNCFIDKFSLQTIKQQKQNPRNVVLQMVPKRPHGQNQILQPNETIKQQDQTIHLLGTLDQKYEKFISLKCISQNSQNIIDLEQYAEGKAPLSKGEILDIQDHTVFAQQFVDANKLLNKGDEDYCCNFPKAYKNVNMIAFDTNFGESFDDHAEIFALKSWAPYNSIKIYEYDYKTGYLTELYEIPIDKSNLEKIQSLQLVRISDDELTYSLMIDWCSYKEVFQLRFNRVVTKKPSNVKHYFMRKTTTSLLGKFDIICPNLYDCSYKSGRQQKSFHLNQQMKMVANYKLRDAQDPNSELSRDGFSLMIDQVRFDFDYQYQGNIPGRERLPVSYQSRSNIFDYEFENTYNIKKNINQENTNDDKYFQCLILKIKIREDIQSTKFYTENQKLKLLRYFAQTMQVHSEPNYCQLFKPVCTSSSSIRELIQPRSELYGQSIIAFKANDESLVERVIEYIQNDYNHALRVLSSSIAARFVPQMAYSTIEFHRHQKNFYIEKMRLCELDMNLMSPITWSFFNKCHNSAKLFTQCIKEYAPGSDKKLIRDHSTIFYGAVNKLIDIGIISLEEFLNPDGVGEDEGCEIFQQTLTQSFLPQFAENNKLFVNEYVRSIESLERNMSSALYINKIQHPQNIHHQDKSEIKEVQYGLIDIDWINMLNIFDQKPLSRVKSEQKPSNKMKAKRHVFSIEKAVQQHKKKAQTLIEVISESQGLEIFTFESVKILIDHSWDSVGYDFFKTQFAVFFIFFMLPFAVDLYYMEYMIENKELRLNHFIWNFTALFCQFLFFFNEIVQMSIKGTELSSYFTDFWNQNDIMCFPTYLALQITLWVTMSSDENIALSTQIAIKILYMIVVVQTFIKFTFLIRIYPSLGFVIQVIGKIVVDLIPFFIFTLLYNIFFATLFMILDPVVDFDSFWAPFKWMTFAFRNAMHDLDVDGFEKSEDVNGVIMYITWIVWLSNLILMTIVLMNFLIAIIGQTYEQFMSSMEARTYQQKAELIVEAQQILKWLGYFKSGQNQKTILIRKKKFSDDVAERLDKEKWSGITQTLKTYLQFCVINKIDHVEEQNAKNTKKLSAQIQSLASQLKALKPRETQQTIQTDPQNYEEAEEFLELSRSRITYNAQMNNVSH